MTRVKLKFCLITILAVLLAGGSGLLLKQGADSMSRMQIFGWGFIFIAACLTAARGIRYLMSMR